MIIFGWHCVHHKDVVKTGLEGSTLPSFTLQLPDSTSYFNTALIPSGKPTVVLLFSPDCPYCRAETSDIIHHITQLTDIQFYLVTPSSFSEMKQFYSHFKIDQYKNITVGRDTANSFLSYCKATVIPYAAIYSKNKVLKEVLIGKSDVEEIIAISQE
jgi:thiol-disulfide isomerase/thioredoxin